MDLYFLQFNNSFGFIHLKSLYGSSYYIAFPYKFVASRYAILRFLDVYSYRFVPAIQTPPRMLS